MWRECQNWVSKLAPRLLLALLACTVTYAQKVRTHYMPGTDFSKYHAYAWVSDIQGLPAAGGHPDQILDADVKQAIDLQMAAKGFTKVNDSSTADLLLATSSQSIGKSKPMTRETTWEAGEAGRAGVGGRGGAASLEIRPVLPTTI